MSCHLQYSKDEAEMAEGNPTLALERDESVQMPPALYLQGTADLAHPKQTGISSSRAIAKPAGAWSCTSLTV
jgi:predicted Rossmann fold nucleotide-binding protein DprA/Smf involved in DNA uptake